MRADGARRRPLVDARRAAHEGDDARLDLDGRQQLALHGVHDEAHPRLAVPLEGRTAVVVLSGANVDADVLARALAGAGARVGILGSTEAHLASAASTLSGVYGADRVATAVADAIEDHYKPRFAGDALPRNHTGTVLALADKIETLVGLFGIGQLPTGDKDPFALRRHALGVIRVLIESNLPLGLDALLSAAVPAFGALITDPTQALGDFVYDRLAGSLREQGYSAQEVAAVLGLRPTRLADVAQRLEAVRAFAALPEAAQDRALSEATAFAIRIDVAEELTRLVSHFDEMDALLKKGGNAEGVGKRLDFLIQELHREANTLGSKSATLEMTRISVDMKVLIEQLREQVQNLE